MIVLSEEAYDWEEFSIMKKHSKDAIQQLGPLELKVMKIVWELETATVSDVHKRLGENGEQFAYTTIMTTMSKLEKKGFLTHKAKGRTYHYQAVISDDGVRTNYLTDIINKLFDGSPGMLVSHLMELDKLSKKDVEEIKKMIEKADL